MSNASGTHGSSSGTFGEQDVVDFGVGVGVDAVTNLSSAYAMNAGKANLGESIGSVGRVGGVAGAGLVTTIYEYDEIVNGDAAAACGRVGSSIGGASVGALVGSAVGPPGVLVGAVVGYGVESGVNALGGEIASTVESNGRVEHEWRMRSASREFLSDQLRIEKERLRDYLWRFYIDCNPVCGPNPAFDWNEEPMPGTRHYILPSQE